MNDNWQDYWDPKSCTYLHTKYVEIFFQLWYPKSEPTCQTSISSQLPLHQPCYFRHRFGAQCFSILGHGLGLPGVHDQIAPNHKVTRLKKNCSQLRVQYTRSWSCHSPPTYIQICSNWLQNVPSNTQQWLLMHFFSTPWWAEKRPNLQLQKQGRLCPRNGSAGLKSKGVRLCPEGRMMSTTSANTLIPTGTMSSCAACFQESEEMHIEQNPAPSYGQIFCSFLWGILNGKCERLP